MSPSKPAITVYLARSLAVSGCPVEGEVELDFNMLQRDNIQEVHIKLRGHVRTSISTNSTTYVEVIQLVRENVSLWCQGGAYPPPDSNTLRIPFRLDLQPYLPPSFYYRRPGLKGEIRYAVTAVGTRPGVLSFNRRIHVPLAIVPKDIAGVGIREKLALMAATGAETGWRTERKEEKIRRGLWGDYSTVHVELQIPDIAVCPLYVPIPFVVKIKTISAPVTRAKANAHPPTSPVFPPVPANYGGVQFKLQSKLFLKTRSYKTKASADVLVIKPQVDSGVALVEDVPARKWVLLDLDYKETPGEVSPDIPGTWIQEATFRSTLRLDCPPTFALDLIKCNYELALKVPFPGVGNDVSLVVPIVITSGLEAPLDRDQPDALTGPLDLPPSYWDAGDGAWDDDIKD